MFSSSAPTLGSGEQYEELSGCRTPSWRRGISMGIFTGHTHRALTQAWVKASDGLVAGHRAMVALANEGIRQCSVQKQHGSPSSPSALPE